MFGLTLSLAAIVILDFFTNPLAASLAALAIIFYVGVYSLLLKRRTTQNIVWGGIAGCFPVVIGWSAVTGSLAIEALLLFLVVFFWTPPHYWPLSIKFRDEYANANIPMLPVIATDVVVTRQIILYSWLMTIAAMSLALFTGKVYFSIALIANAWFLFEAYKLHSAVKGGLPAERSAMKLFHGSITYLSLIFLAVGADALIRW